MQHSAKACIITIGDELLIGQVIDTNSAFIASELNAIGIWVKRRVAVGDNWDEIWNALDQESKSADIILITGGLGPTADDITKPLLCKYFNGKLVTDPTVLEQNRYLFENIFRRPFTERNQKQAEVPDTCTVIPNKRGTAPAMLFEKNGILFVSMPGVPHEMKGIMTDSVIPLLRQRFKGTVIAHRTLLTAGIGESNLADHIMQWEEQLPANIKLAYLPSFGMVRLRLTITVSEQESGLKELDSQFHTLKQLVREWMVTDEDRSIPQVVAALLKKHNRTLSTAESCTGGYIAHLITKEAGASQYYDGGVVSYSNRIKQQLLQVKQATLDQHGAVSEETVREMAEGTLQTMNTDYALAISGIMGPDGGSEKKPVGLVWVAVAHRNKMVTQQFNFRFDRNRNIEMSANNALNLLRKLIIDTTN